MSISPVAELQAPPEWRMVDLISDLHLQPEHPATVEAWRGYLQTTPADAIFILGDLFEAWVGDDAAEADGFEAQCGRWLREASEKRSLYFMHGNRDFLVGERFAAQAGFTLLQDPTVLVFMGERWLLSHGDALCLDDVQYQKFRQQVRNPQWQQAVLAQPLDKRRQMAHAARAQSEAHQQSPDMVWADVDTAAAQHWLREAQASVLVHGHTHRPAEHDLGDGMKRIVLSDWDAEAAHPRAQVMCLTSAGLRRVDLR
ncbi:UDP-2,3-diacylglucosamine diphosphatase [Variovorax dokdonensis]|uniref:UDP-2,3-diacylglucosamine hydrolase n=1 Tax=Variovorax dokdonensis TaxID=344883 RepID=A0ABT7NCY2_9BURK|nr:UDP-2,3-diacylglucosamine diphosphatase [Variovorax dokdonensis]MDM0045814.1 UDP-2,3-diacylglucosamine diphosphatase [Variovorax dokdonensis]